MWVRYTYLFIDIGSILVPFIFTFHPKIKFNKAWKAFALAVFITASLFIAWDCIYTYSGVWGFNENYITGIKFFNLPLEEVLFFFCIPYSSMFTYYCFRKFRLKFTDNLTKWITNILFPALILLGCFYINRLYTGVTFIILSAFLFYFLVTKKINRLNTFYSMYLVILLPFFIVNGILTGSGIDEPIVWYNNHENTGVRILTIPIEDIFYGLLLLLLNTLLFEFFQQKYERKNSADISL